MNNNSYKKRKTVEIYFILYLAALLFLLPDKNDKQKDTIVDNSISNFSIYPEKTNLNAQFYLDVNGVKILEIDSINNIYANAKYENISFSFTIIDPITNQTKEINEHFGDDIYKVSTNKANSSAKFIWTPEKTIKSNLSYIVAVSAIIKLNNDSRQYQSKTQFTLNVIFKNKPELDSANNNQQQDINDNINRILDSLRMLENNININPGDFTINPEKSVVNMPAMQKWSNTVNFYNINIFRDLKSKPNIEISGNAQSKYKSINSEILENKIIFTGIIPSSGNIKVKVSAERKTDGTIKSTSFIVKQIPIEDAIFDKVMYVGMTYLIDPNLPLINRNAYAELRTNTEKLKISKEGTKFYYTPTSKDIGKIISLRRYLDNNMIEEDLKIKVLDVPQPEIISIQKLSNGDIELKTVSYGSYNNDKNLVNQIECSTDINYRELYGNLEENKDKFSYIQTFIISLKNTQSTKLIFTIKDKSGNYSNQRIFNY